MKLFPVAAALIVLPVIAMAADTQPQTPQVQALQQTVIKLTGENLDWQAQAIALKAQVEDLTKKLDAAKASTPATDTPPK